MVLLYIGPCWRNIDSLRIKVMHPRLVSLSNKLAVIIVVHNYSLNSHLAKMCAGVLGWLSKVDL